MAHSPKQARQFIVHGHVSINGRKMTIPGYLVLKDEEGAIEYRPGSPLSSDMHPERPGAEKPDTAPDEEGGDSQVKGKVKLEDGGEGEGGKSSSQREDGGEAKEEGGKKEDKADEKTDDKAADGEKKE
jgi:ribosomal protein S4